MLIIMIFDIKTDSTFFALKLIQRL